MGGLRALKKSCGKCSQKGFLSFQKVPRTPPRRVQPLRRSPHECTESAILNQESGGSESCDSKVAWKWL